MDTTTWHSPLAITGLPAAWSRVPPTGNDAANVVTARRLVEEVWNGGDLAVLDEIAADDVRTEDGAWSPGREAWKAHIATVGHLYDDLVPGVCHTIEELVAGDGTVALWGYVRGTSARGVPFNALSISVLGFRDGRIASVWTAEDSQAIADAL